MVVFVLYNACFHSFKFFLVRFKIFIKILNTYGGLAFNIFAYGWYAQATFVKLPFGSVFFHYFGIDEYLFKANQLFFVLIIIFLVFGKRRRIYNKQAYR